MPVTPSYDPHIEEAARETGLDPNIIRAVIRAESAGNAKAQSRVGAKGLMQLMDATARELGVTDSFDPRQNILGGSRYLKQQLDQFGNLDSALAAYNAGPGAVRRHGGVPPFRETQDYVAKINKFLSEGGISMPTPAGGGNNSQFMDIFSNLNLGHPDPSQFIDPYVEANRASALQIRQASREAERDPRNIVDKIAPVLELIGFLADRTSGNKYRRAAAPQEMANVRAARKARIDRRRSLQRQKYLDRLAEQELLGSLRGRSFSAEMGGVQTKTSQIGTKASVASGIATRRAAKARTEAAGAPKQGDIEAAHWFGLAKSGFDKLNKGAAFDELTPDEQTAVRKEGYEPDNTGGALMDIIADANKRAEGRYGKLIAEAQAAGDTETAERLQGMYEAMVAADLQQHLGAMDLFGFGADTDVPTSRVTPPLLKSHETDAPWPADAPVLRQTGRGKQEDPAWWKALLSPAYWYMQKSKK